MTVALMYHALYRGDVPSDIDSEDRPYAVSEAAFAAQLDVLADFRVGLLPCSIAGTACDSHSDSAIGQSVAPPDIVITFDDGHVSNYELALPLLQARGLSAYFFITSSFIDQRTGFCSAAQIRDLAKAGMMVGSHGVSHAFFDDLSPVQAQAELSHSRERLMQLTDGDITSLSFPGGRYTQDTLSMARTVGYAQLFASSFGTIPVGAETTGQALNRVAIRRGTTLEEFRRIVNADVRYFTVQKSKQQLKWLARRALGNRLYHGLYKSVSAG